MLAPYLEKRKSMNSPPPGAPPFCFEMMDQAPALSAFPWPPPNFAASSFGRLTGAENGPNV